VFGTALLASSASPQTRPAAPQSPYGGVTVEDIVARVNDQIITQSDYDRAMKEMDDEAKQHGATMQQISEGHKDLLRDLVDRQLWLSKGKELSINGETELIKRLDQIRKQYNMETLEDLEKAAKQQGVSFEDFKANIRNTIITQEVMRHEVGRRIQITPGEVQRFFDQHKQEYARPESVQLSEILVSTGADPDDQAKTAAGKAKADDIEAKLHAGGDFSQLAKSFSDGTTAGAGGAFGTFRKGELAKVFEDATFTLKAGQYTDPIRTKQGYIIFKVDQHISGGVPEYKEVEQDVEQNYYESRMMPAMRDYLTQMREEAYIDIKPAYVDSGASPKQIKPVYSAYTPPTPKKKKKVERTRFRETTRTFRQKSPQAAGPADTTAAAAPAAANPGPTKKNAGATVQKAGKKEKSAWARRPPRRCPLLPPPLPRMQAL
jgi:peptidyl-prolyl cis-trans isomerase SurA